MNWQQVVLISLFAANAMLALSMIDEPRKPITATTAVLMLPLNALLIWMVTTI